MATARASSTAPPSLAGRAARRDAALFRGRSAELERLEAALDAPGPARSVALSGPSGIGKSALVRELARRAAARGVHVTLLDAADPPPRPRPAGRPGRRRRLLVLDHAELATAELLGALDRGADLTVAAGTELPSGVLRQTTLRMRLGPLSNAEARELLAARGVAGAARRDELVAWAQGSPLALVCGDPRGLRRALERRVSAGPDAEAGLGAALMGLAPLPESASGEDAGAEAVREALRAWHEPDALARSPLARGADEAGRAEGVRALLREAIARGFGSSGPERELRRTVEAAYIERRASHEATAEALNLSRSAYFARLRRGVERVVPYALDGLARAAG